jgi:hypothetical protein
MWCPRTEEKFNRGESDIDETFHAVDDPKAV